MFDLERELETVVAAFGAARIPYALCGGLAVSVHGFPRATVDIDVLVLPEDEERVYAAAAPLGFALKAKPMNFDGGRTQIRGVSKIDRDDGEALMLDLLLVTPAVRDVWDHRQRFQWHGRELDVVSRQGLIDLKRSRSSAIDLADIEKLSGK